MEVSTSFVEMSDIFRLSYLNIHLRTLQPVDFLCLNIQSLESLFISLVSTNFIKSELTMSGSQQDNSSESYRHNRYTQSHETVEDLYDLIFDPLHLQFHRMAYMGVSEPTRETLIRHNVQSGPDERNSPSSSIRYRNPVFHRDFPSNGATDSA